MHAEDTLSRRHHSVPDNEETQPIETTSVVNSEKKRKPSKKSKKKGVDRAWRIYIAVIIAFSSLVFLLYLSLDTEEERNGLYALLRKIHRMHRYVARSVRYGLGFRKSTPINEPPLGVIPSLPTSEASTLAEIPETGQSYILPRPQFIRFSSLKLPDMSAHIDISSLAPLYQSNGKEKRPTPQYLEKPSPELKPLVPKPPKDKTKAPLPSPQISETSRDLPTLEATSSVGLSSLPPSDGQGDQDALRLAIPLRGSSQPIPTTTTVATTLPAAAPKSPEKLKPSQKAKLKSASFRLGKDKIEHLLSSEVDVVLHALLLEMRGSISCGGRPIINFREFDEIKEVSPNLLEVLPEANDLLEKVGRRSSSSSSGSGGHEWTLGRTCAVVGNSGVLLDADRGAEIDSHDAVIRFNAAPTKGFETHVGTKTTIRIQNVDHLGFKERQDAALIFSARTDKDVKKYIAHRKKPQYASRLQYMFNPEFWCHVWDWVEHRKLKPSSGLAGVVLALHNCEGPVSLYGFSHNSTKFHYFDQLPRKVTEEEVYWYHPLVEETAVFQELEGMDRLKQIS